MTGDELSTQVRRFIGEHITSVAQLEMLLLLRTNPQESWTAAELARELRIEPAWAVAQLQNLCDRGLLECSDGNQTVYCYKPRSSELEQAVTAVAQAYLLHRVRVIEVIYGKPNATIRAFADAFKFRKDDPRG